MKKIFTLAVVAFATMSLSSCFTTTSSVAYSGNSTGTVKTSKVAHGSSGLILGIFGNKDDKNSVEVVAAKAGITKVERVEYAMKWYVGGIYMVNTTTVYGE